MRRTDLRLEEAAIRLPFRSVSIYAEMIPTFMLRPRSPSGQRRFRRTRSRDSSEKPRSAAKAGSRRSPGELAGEMPKIAGPSE